jgi:hypothetical protein
MTLSLRMIGLDDYTVHEERQLIGRIRFASDRLPPLWLWTCTVTLPRPPFGDAATLDQAKERFAAAWATFKEPYGAEELAKTFDAMNHANRPDRYR